MNTDQQVGQRVGALMHEQGITQGAMASRMGITQAAISRKLSGERPWFADELVLAAGILGVQVGQLFGEQTRPRRLRTAGAAMVKGKQTAALVFSG